MTSDLKQKTVKNVSYTAAGWVITFLFQAVANVVMTRTLQASDYGIAGMAVIFLNFFSQFSDLGITTALVQKADMTERDLYTAFGLRALLGCAIFLLSVLTMPLANAAFGNQGVGLLIVVFSLNYLINIFGFIPVALMRRDLSYGKLFFPQVAYAASSALLGIVLALNGFGYWSLVFSLIGATLVYVALTNSLRPVPIRFQFHKETALSFLRFGSNVALTGVIGFALLNADNFVVGALQGSAALGFYIIAFNWGSLICTIITAVVSNVLLPTFSRLQGDKQRLKAAYLKLLEFVTPLALGANLLLFLASKEFLYLVLGHSSEKWFPSLAALQILCLYGVLRSLLEPASNAFLSLGLPRLMLRASLLAAVIELGLLYPAIRYGGIEAVAVVVTVAAASQHLVYLGLLKKHLGISPRQVLAKVAPAFGAMAGAALPLLYGFQFLGQLSWLTFAVKTATTLALFLLLHGLLTRWTVLREVRFLLAGSGLREAE